MPLDLVQCQMRSIEKMLHLDVSKSLVGGWKILIVDDAGLDIIAPLFTVGQMKQYNVASTLRIDSQREAVSQVDAVYFVTPTWDNLKIIANDIGMGVYGRFHINLTTPLSDDSLRFLADGISTQISSRKDSIQRISGLVERYTSFTALSSHIFTLGCPDTYKIFHTSFPVETLIVGDIQKIVDGLVSVLCTVKVVPYIRVLDDKISPIGTNVGKCLDSRLRCMLQSPSNILFDGADRVERPVLIIIDRDIDQRTLLLHGWTYRSLIHDILGLRNNKVQIVSNGEPPKSYTLDSRSDVFMSNHSESNFPDVATAVSSLTKKYEDDRKSILQKSEITGDMSRLPELTEAKARLDKHSNIATALLTEIKRRSIDKLVELEDSFQSLSMRSSDKVVNEVCRYLEENAGKGDDTDKLRLCTVLLCQRPSLAETHVKRILDFLRANSSLSESQLTCLHYTRTLQKSHRDIVRVVPQGKVEEGHFTNSGSQVFTASSVLNIFTKQGEDLISKGISGIKTLLPMQSETPVIQVLNRTILSESHTNSNEYKQLDPLDEAKKNSTIPKKLIVFVCGGGNYIEYYALKKWAEKNKISLTYGTTEFIRPTDFCQVLSALGEELNRKS